MWLLGLLGRSNLHPMQKSCSEGVEVSLGQLGKGVWISMYYNERIMSTMKPCTRTDVFLIKL
ncbi:MAG: hypothetical protein ABI180_13485 [Microcoleus sp.]